MIANAPRPTHRCSPRPSLQGDVNRRASPLYPHVVSFTQPGQMVPGPGDVAHGANMVLNPADTSHGSSVLLGSEDISHGNGIAGEDTGGTAGGSACHGKGVLLGARGVSHGSRVPLGAGDVSHRNGIAGDDAGGAAATVDPVTTCNWKQMSNQCP
jgi:hypothetical protein